MNTPLLTKVRLERFKAAFKPKAIELRPFSVIIGRNGSGKSTLLEALQWIDVTIRRHAVEACKRYAGIQDLLNLRSDTSPGFFGIECEWKQGRHRVHYKVKVQEASDGMTPIIKNESLTLATKPLTTVISLPLSTDHLALAYSEHEDAAPIREFWRRFVFLRLNPSSLAEGSPPRRATSDPLLDEVGMMLPALLLELNDEQRGELVRMVQDVLPGMRGVEVSNPRAGRSERVHYELTEEMKYKGRDGLKEFKIPAWMLSEGTRRLTAIFALLVHKPAPSLVCIEEVENGLDPWAVHTLLRYLRDASERGVQILVTTHSPWVLDEVKLEDVILVRRKDGNSVYEPFAKVPAVMAFAETIPPGTRYTNLEDTEEVP